MMKMSKRGENIYKRKDGRWEVRVKLNESQGKYKYLYAATYKEAKEKLYAFKSKMQSEQTKTVLLSELCNDWLYYKQQDIKESTYIKYRNIIEKHIIPFFSNTNISRIQTADIHKFVIFLKTDGISNKTVKDILSVLSSVFKYSAKVGVSYNNIDFEGICPKSEKKQIKLLPSHERIMLEHYLINLKNYTGYGILLSLYSGLRIGELCALKWENIDLKSEIISVTNTLQRLQDKDNKGKTKILISEPKSQNSKRIIPIPKFIIHYLEEIKPDKKSAYLLTGNDSFVEPKTLENRYKKILKESNIPYINFHSLRHTFASRCIEVGFDIKSLSEILGHSSVSTTLNLYVHPTLEYKKSNMNKLTLLE